MTKGSSTSREAVGSPSQPLRLSSPHGRWVLAVTVLGSGIAFLEATVINVALPALGRDLDADVAALQWTIDGYLLTLASLILLGGSLGDRYGRRRIFELGVTVFTATSVLSALAPSVETLIGARILQGVGGALLAPGSLAIIEATFHPDDRGRAIGAWSALGGVAGAVGPLLGGYLVTALSWRAVFLINIPLGAFVVYASRRHVPETRDPTISGRLDVAGSVLVALALAGLTFALIQAPAQGVASGPVVGAIAIGIIASIAFVVTERRSRQPMLPLSIFSSRQFASANLVTVAVYAALGGVLFLLVVFLQVALGYSPVAAGAATLPVTALMLALSPRAGALAQRIGPRLPLTVGPLLIAAGMLMMRGIDIGDAYLGSVLPAVVVYGLGLSLVVAPVTATVLAAADARHSGVASGVNNAVARTAQLAAVAVLPLVAGLSGSAYRQPQALADGFHVAMLVTAGLAAAGGILAWATIRNDVLERPRRRRLWVREPATTRHCAVAGTPLLPAPSGERPRQPAQTPAPAAASER